MAEPGAEAAGGMTAPPPPPLPQNSDTPVGDATTTPPLLTDTADPVPPASTPTPPPHQTAAAETAGQPQPHQPGATSTQTQRQTRIGEVAGTPQLTHPPPPPPTPTQKSDTAVDDMTTSTPLQTETADPDTPGSTPTPPPQNQIAAAEASGAASPPTLRQTGTGEVAGSSLLTQTLSQEKTVAAGAENHLPAPPPLPQEQGDIAKDGNESKDSAMENPRQAEEEKSSPSRWRRVRSPVLLLLSLFRLRHGRQDQLNKQPTITPPPTEDDSAGDVPHTPATEKEEGEGSKRRRHEEEASVSASGRKEAPPREPHQTKRRKSLQRTDSVLPPEGGVGSQADANPSPMKRKFQNACRLVKNTMSWYRRHRSPENVEDPEEEAAAEKEKLAEAKPSASPPEEAETKSKQDGKMDQSTKQPSPPAQEGQSSPIPKKMPQWAEERLEATLEESCMMLLESEFGNRLNDMQQQCLLTLSVFPVGSKVKNHAVTYWWSTLFKLPPEKGVEKADEIFSMLSGGGFLEPIKNPCSEVVHGCQVNPLVHWMVKRMSREKGLADLDDRGNPADVQPKSKVLCLTPGNRDQMQRLRDDDDPQARIRPSPTKAPPHGKVEAGAPCEDQQDKTKLEAENLQATILFIYRRKKVILNISAHVYRLPKPLLIKLADQLEVLQLGRWGNYDDETYMEVGALESLSSIGKLKNLRYLSLRGLSRLTELPSQLRQLRRLAILDARGCQNLVSVPSATVQKLKGLTHLDLTECFMLEHIGRGVSALSELRVFKGFVFGVGKRRRDACRLQHLAKLKKLRKLNINVTTDANVEKDEMAQLGKLASLDSLTVTWGEWPSVLLDDCKKDQMDELRKRWTSLRLPPGLEKLDVRCYPDPELPVKRWLHVNGRTNLKKLYVRGGEVEELDIPIDNNIETLRLRYLNKFRMNWATELLPKLNGNLKRIKRVEVVDKDLKVMRNQTKGKGDDKVKDEHEKKKVNEEEERELVLDKDLSRKIKKRMKIPESTIDENGVWVKDPKEEEAAADTTPQDDPPKAQAAADTTPQDDPRKEEAAPGDAAKTQNGDDGKAQKEVKGKQSGLIKGSQGENEQAAEEDRGDTSEKKKVDGGDSVKEEKDHMKTVKDKEHDIIKRDAKEHEPTVVENRMQERGEQELKEDVEKRASPTLDVAQTAAPGSGGDIKIKDTGIDNFTDKISEVKEEPDDRVRGAKGQDEPPTKEDKGDVGEIRKFDGGDADEPQAEGEDEGQKEDSKVFDMVEEQPTVGQDGGGGVTSAADVTSSLAPQPPEPEDEENPAKLIAPAKTTARTVTPPAFPPAAATSVAPAAAVQAAAEPKEHGVTGHGDGSTSTGTAGTE
ncbi:uncharacterized protein LOC124690113 [Lolium rigidum]|uniref:uncharacterized protein LOC124690113 n=1 Tax=Lolium rigidum TaxID=89674 RepID=UPI001F5D043E|nr:uncharacterized protein LOC124690113 [Lolium rigidum]